MLPESLDEALSLLVKWFDEITRAKLSGLDDFALNSLKRGDWIPEMDYLVPTAQVSVERINDLCVKSADEVFPTHLPLRLNEKMLCGFITGSLDLVLRAPLGGRMRYFVADYKSTLLGRCYEDYAPSEVTAPRLIDTLRMMNIASLAKQNYTGVFKRTEVTEVLHKLAGVRFDCRLITAGQVEKAMKASKRLVRPKLPD